MPTWVSILISMTGFVLGGGFLGFMQFLISRHDEKKGKKSKELEAINALEAKVDNQERKMEQRFTDVDRKFASLIARMDEDNANDARIRILNFSDEIMHKRRHSEESFNQSLSDITLYEAYCDGHPSYKNARAKVAIANIQATYERCVKEGSFLGMKGVNE